MKKVKNRYLWSIFLSLLFFTPFSVPFCIEASQTGIDLESIEDEEILSDELSEDVSDEDVSQIIEDYFRNTDILKDSVGENLPDDQAVRTISPSEMAVEVEDSQKFLYHFPDGNYFTSTVPCGMISSDPVDVQVSAGSVGIVRQDDVIHTPSDSWHFTEKGSYEIQVLSYQSTGEKEKQSLVYETFFYFCIASSPDNTLGAIPAPENFRISAVFLNGKEQLVENPRVFFLKGDGRYEIEYISRDNPGLLISTSLVRDTTAPFLSFSPELKNGEAAGMVEFIPSEPDCTVYMVYNGEQGYAVSSQLTTAGSYDLTVEDAAKNQRNYHFRIRQVYRLVDFRLIGTGAVLLLLMGVRFFFLRRDMKVI